jgi:hypothetical protein
VSLLIKYVERARRLEEEGRRIAFEREKPVGDEVLQWLDDVDATTVGLRDFLEKVVGERVWARFADWIGWMAEVVKSEATDCKARGAKIGECAMSERVELEMEGLDEIYKSASGKKRCTWLVGVKKPYTLSAAVNDLAACLHRAVERAEEFLASWEREGKCMWRK